MMDMVGEGMSHLNLDADEREEAVTSSNMTKISKKEALPRVIDWIKHNYEESDSSCLPKHLVYQHYQEFCIASHLQCTNMANFGKIIRSVFPQLKTRRLGPRGKTKHHYHGIRLSAVSTLEMPSQVQTGRRVAQRSSKSSSSSSGQKGGGGDGNSSNLPSSPRSMTTHSTRNRSSSDTSLTPMNDSSGGSGVASPLKRRRRTHGSRLVYSHGDRASRKPPTLPNFELGDRELEALLADSKEENLKKARQFLVLYHVHCQLLVSSVCGLNFDQAETSLKAFWVKEVEGLLLTDLQIILSDFIIEKDKLVYSSIFDYFFENELQPFEKGHLEALVHFAKTVTSWVQEGTRCCYQSLAARKLQEAFHFSIRFRKNCRLGLLVQKTREMFSPLSVRSQMVVDWDDVEIDIIQDKTFVECPVGMLSSNKSVILSVTEGIREMIQGFTIEQCMQWLRHFADNYLVAMARLSYRLPDMKLHSDSVSSAYQLLFNWSLYTSLIMRDLTCRDAPSIEPFHQLFVLFNAYLSHYIENRIQHLPSPRSPYPPPQYQQHQQYQQQHQPQQQQFYQQQRMPDYYYAPVSSPHGNSSNTTASQQQPPYFPQQQQPVSSPSFHSSFNNSSNRLSSPSPTTPSSSHQSTEGGAHANCPGCVDSPVAPASPKAYMHHPQPQHQHYTAAVPASSSPASSPPPHSSSPSSGPPSYNKHIGRAQQAQQQSVLLPVKTERSPPFVPVSMQHYGHNNSQISTETSYIKIEQNPDVHHHNHHDNNIKQEGQLSSSSQLHIPSSSSSYHDYPPPPSQPSPPSYHENVQHNSNNNIDEDDMNAAPSYPPHHYPSAAHTSSASHASLHHPPQPPMDLYHHQHQTDHNNNFLEEMQGEAEQEANVHSFVMAPEEEESQQHPQPPHPQQGDALSDPSYVPFFYDSTQPPTSILSGMDDVEEFYSY